MKKKKKHTTPPSGYLTGREHSTFRFLENEYSTHRIWNWYGGHQRQYDRGYPPWGCSSMRRKSQRWRGRIRKSIMQDRRHNGISALWIPCVTADGRYASPKPSLLPDNVTSSRKMKPCMRELFWYARKQH